MRKEGQPVLSYCWNRGPLERAPGVASSERSLITVLKRVELRPSDSFFWSARCSAASHSIGGVTVIQFLGDLPPLSFGISRCFSVHRADLVLNFKTFSHVLFRLPSPLFKLGLKVLSVGRTYAELLRSLPDHRAASGVLRVPVRVRNSNRAFDGSASPELFQDRHGCLEGTTAHVLIPLAIESSNAAAPP